MDYEALSRRHFSKAPAIQLAPEWMHPVQQQMANEHRIRQIATDSNATQNDVVCPEAPAAVRPRIFFSSSPKLHRHRPLYFDAPEFGFIDQLLDIGGGDGQVASLLKLKQPQLKITVFDFGPVCNQALDWFLARGQADDLGAHAGDLFIDPLPSGFSAAQFSHVLELFPAERILWLLKKAFDALPRGGKLFIYGHATDEERMPMKESSWCLPRYPLFATGSSRLYAVSQYLRWLRVVGFTRINHRHDGAQTIFLMAIK